MKIAITGHTRGIGKALFDTLGVDNEVIGFSKSTGYDISTDRAKIVKESLDCDVFINNAYCGSSLLALFEDIFAYWKDDPSKSIVNVGSLAKHSQVRKDGVRTKYSINKKALSTASVDAVFRHFCKCNVTCMNPGWVATWRATDIDDKDKMTIQECADLIIALYDNYPRIVDITFTK
jgi:short-subunit dehydrogenase